MWNFFWNGALTILIIFLEYKLACFILPERNLTRLKRASIFITYFLFRMYLSYSIEPMFLRLTIVFTEIFIVNYFIFKGEFINRIATIISQITFTTFFEINNVFLYRAIEANKFSEPIVFFINFMVFIGILYWFEEVMEFKNINSLTKKQKKYFIVSYGFILITIFSILLLNNANIYLGIDQVKFSGEHIFIFVIVFYIIITLIFALMEPRNNNVMTNDKKRMQALNEYYSNQLEIYESNEKKIKKIKHDCNNHLTTLTYFIKKNKKDEAFDYIKNMSELMDTEQEYIYTGITSVDSILNYKIHEAKCKNINVEYSVNIMDDIKIKSIDLTTIIGNLIDNAIEALEKLMDKRFLKINLHTKKGLVFISVINNFNGELNKNDGTLMTTKSEEDFHGIGLNNISEIVEKYNGEMEISTDNNEFKVNLALFNEVT